jgi:hypothetical protein
MTRSFHLPASKALWAALALFLFAGCSASRGDLPLGEAQIDAKVARLQAHLKGLGAHTDAAEAHRVAQTAVTYSYRLAEEYRVAPPARWHNLLIQMGFRDRGLCFHWTEDLMKRLLALDLKTYRLHWGVAHRGSDLREHNSVVVTARDQPFEKGLVLDPWRNSGDLYWAAVSQDRYPWEPLPPDQW